MKIKKFKPPLKNPIPLNNTAKINIDSNNNVNKTRNKENSLTTPSSPSSSDNSENEGKVVKKSTNNKYSKPFKSPLKLNSGKSANSNNDSKECKLIPNEEESDDEIISEPKKKVSEKQVKEKKVTKKKIENFTNKTKYKKEEKEKDISPIKEKDNVNTSSTVSNLKKQEEEEKATMPKTIEDKNIKQNTPTKKETNMEISPLEIISIDSSQESDFMSNIDPQLRSQYKPLKTPQLLSFFDKKEEIRKDEKKEVKKKPNFKPILFGEELETVNSVLGYDLTVGTEKKKKKQTPKWMEKPKKKKEEKKTQVKISKFFKKMDAPSSPLKKKSVTFDDENVSLTEEDSIPEEDNEKDNDSKQKRKRDVSISPPQIIKQEHVSPEMKKIKDEEEIIEDDSTNISSPSLPVTNSLTYKQTGKTPENKEIKEITPLKLFENSSPESVISIVSENEEKENAMLVSPIESCKKQTPILKPKGIILPDSINSLNSTESSNSFLSWGKESDIMSLSGESQLIRITPPENRKKVIVSPSLKQKEPEDILKNIKKEKLEKNEIPNHLSLSPLIDILNDNVNNNNQEAHTPSSTSTHCSLISPSTLIEDEKKTPNLFEEKVSLDFAEEENIITKKNTTGFLNYPYSIDLASTPPYQLEEEDKETQLDDIFFGSTSTCPKVVNKTPIKAKAFGRKQTPSKKRFNQQSLLFNDTEKEHNENNEEKVNNQLNNIEIPNPLTNISQFKYTNNCDALITSILQNDSYFAKGEVLINEKNGASECLLRSPPCSSSLEDNNEEIKVNDQSVLNMSTIHLLNNLIL
ncbi:hypothetical protein ABK040_003387 [Willaertia magna]